MSQEGQFVRCLAKKEVIAIAFGAMIGWGWVVLAGQWIQSGGSLGAILAFLLGGLAVIFIGLTYAELAAAMPLVGGEHVYSFRALGETASFICTWAIILGYVSVVAFEAVALPTVLEYLIPNYKVGYLWTVAGWDVYFTWVMVGVIGAVVMTWLNIIGIKMAALFQTVAVLGILVGGILFITGSLFTGTTTNMEPLFVDGTKGMLAVMIMVPFMFVGFDVIPQAAEEIDLPFKEIGNLLIISVLMAVAWYALIILGVAMSLNAEQTAASNLVTADAASAALGGAWGGKLIVLAGIMGIVTSWNAFLVGASRAIFAMAHCHMLPKFLGKLHPKYNTPVNAILLVGVLSVIAPLFGRKTMVWLVDAGGLSIVVAYGLVALSFIVLRRTEPEMKRPFKVAYGGFVGWVALLSSIGLAVLYLPISPAALVWPYEWAIVGIWTVLGVILYAWALMVYGGADAAKILREELISGRSDLPETA